MKEKHYYICKKKNNGEVIYINYDKLNGFNITPRNNVKYDGIIVNKMVIIKPSFVEKILKRKIKRKLDLYLKLIVNFIDSDDSNDGNVLKEALNDLSRYKNIVQYKYRKYLDEKYSKLLLRKIEFLEYELNSRLIVALDNVYEAEKETHRTR